MSMDYERLLALAKARGVRVDALLAMSSVRDPFYVGKPAERAAAEWFGQLWERFGFSYGVHLRRIHYRLVSQPEPIILWFGKAYENTEACWGKLVEASAYARYLGVAAFDAFIDQRNPEPIFNRPASPGSVEVERLFPEGPLTPDERRTSAIVGTLAWFPNLWRPSLPEPYFAIANLEGQQRYHLEIWAEKSTMNDVLDGVCSRYHVNLMTASGELSITQVHRAARRMLRSGKPGRILYLSDFDPAGQNMPVAAARKLEWFVSSAESPLSTALAASDIRLYPVALTQAQCITYGLPRTPIKETEQRKGRFERQYGTGATELDALEALHPGRLARIFADALRPYWDNGLEHRVAEARSQLRHHLEERRRAVVENRQQDLDAIEGEYVALMREYAPQLRALEAEFAPRLEALRGEYIPKLRALDERMAASWNGILETLHAEVDEIDLADFPVPEAEQATDEPSALYDSARTYDEQLSAYKRFQGKGDGEGVDEGVA